MKMIDGGVTAPKGFKAANTTAGIKYEGRDDMAMVFSEVPCVTAATFTKNVVKAAPVLFDKRLVDTSAPVQAIVCNAGIANACTGQEGYDCCKAEARAVAEVFEIPDNATFVASTGVIGMQLPKDKLASGIRVMKPLLSDTREAAHKAARAIMTTDTVPKEAAIQVDIGGSTVTIGAMCKGSGMIHPDMCTMLCFITTDAIIKKDILQKALSEVVEDSFNMISVDGDTSTNDTCAVFANGMAGNRCIGTADASGDAACDGKSDYEIFRDALLAVCTKLARMMASDGEGATHLFEVIVNGAKSKEEAVTLSKSVVSSSLCKAAIYGKDANCGRFMCALGYSGVSFDSELTDIYFESNAGSILVMKQGKMPVFDEDEALKILSEDEITVRCEMNEGEASATAWGCDLTYDYVKINADYRS